MYLWRISIPSLLLIFILLPNDVVSYISAANDTCNIRYQINSKYHTVSNCSAQYIPGCDDVFKIAFSNFPPYVFMNESGHIHGILVEFLDQIIHSCCHGCGKFEFIGPLEGNEIFNVNASLIIPVRTAKTNTHYLGDEFYYLAEMPGVTFMKEKEIIPPSVLSKKMLTAIVDTWPLFVIAFVMSFMSGVVIWVLDMLFNEEHFPRRFPLGIFEGFWWAFISMTTVGYGDRAPKSPVARIFAMLWIFIGITIFAMYTATMTSALADAVGNQDDSILGKKVAVLNLTTEGRLAALKESAIVEEFETIEAIIDALHARVVDGVALDDYINSFYIVEMHTKVPDLFFIKHTLVEGQAYGVAIPPSKHDVSILIESFFYHNEDQRDLILSAIVSHYQKVDHTPHVEEHIQIFAVDSPVFLYCLYGSAVIVVAGCMIGMIMILIDRRRQSMKSVDGIIENAYTKKGPSFENMDIRFAEEAQALCKKWRLELENNPQ